MDLTKQELIEKLTKVHQSMVGLENLMAEENNWRDSVENGKKVLESHKKELIEFILGFIGFGFVTFLIYCFSSRINTGVIIFGGISLLMLLCFILEITSIKSSKKN